MGILIHPVLSTSIDNVQSFRVTVAIKYKSSRNVRLVESEVTQVLNMISKFPYKGAVDLPV
jgi:hypothetical protein